MRKGPGPTESEEQKALAKWLDDRCLWFAVPNERSNVRMLGKLKAMGLKKGVPDIVVLSQPNDEATLQLPIFIELKRAKPRGKVSPEQKRWHHLLRDEGYPVFVAYGAQAAIEFMRGLGY